MYTCIDLISKTEQKFDTQQQLLSFWKWKIQDGYSQSIHAMTFGELNITGNDKHWVAEPTPSILRYTAYIFKLQLKRYQILDEFGRSCDIRTWTQALQEIGNETYFGEWKESSVSVRSQPRFRIDPVEGVHKHRHANKQYAAFAKQKMKDLRNKFDLDFEDDLLGFSPIRNHAKPRIVDQSFRKWKKSDDKCWKTQSKKKAQWERHMRQNSESRGPSRDEEYNWLIEDCEAVLAMEAETGTNFMEYADWME